MLSTVRDGAAGAAKERERQAEAARRIKRAEEEARRAAAAAEAEAKARRQQAEERKRQADRARAEEARQAGAQRELGWRPLHPPPLRARGLSPTLVLHLVLPKYYFGATAVLL